MNFFEHQERALRRSSFLIFLYVIAVTCIICLIYFAIIFSISFGWYGYVSFGWWHPYIFLITTSVATIVIFLASTYKFALLSKGPLALAESIGARIIHPGSEDGKERVFVNVVEEMAIASGLPIPLMAILDFEDSINAFACGAKPTDCMIVVSAGCLTKLTRAELQGVIAHEFSHILNNDVGLNIKLIAILHGILFIKLIGCTMLVGKDDEDESPRFDLSFRASRKGDFFVPVLGLALVVVGQIGSFFAGMIKSSVSRQREFLADASAVQFTRNPAGLLGALLKIRGLPVCAGINNPRAEEFSHMFFADGIKRKFFDIFATHPPLEERIRRLDPSIDLGEDNGELVRKVNEVSDSAMLGFACESAGLVGNNYSNGTYLRPESLILGRELLSRIPHDIEIDLNTSFGAQSAILGLLSDTENVELRKKQIELMKNKLAGEQFDFCKKVCNFLSDKDIHFRLLVLDRAIARLAFISKQQCATFEQLTAELVEVDGNLSLFEFVIGRLLDRALWRIKRQWGVDTGFQNDVLYHNMGELRVACEELFSILVVYGHEQLQVRVSAFEKAKSILGLPNIKIVPENEISLDRLDDAIEQLRRAAPMVKQTVTKAVRECVAFDGEIRPVEGQILRVVNAMLEVPSFL